VPALAEPSTSTPGPASVRWGDLRTRVISASILVPVCLACLWFGGLLWDGLVLLAGIGMADEWRRLCARRHDGGVGLRMLGVPAILPGVAAMLWLRADGDVGLINIGFVMSLVWASDIGAYAAGRTFGGRRLAPAISPGKTWSGAVGGLACAMLVGLVAGHSARAVAIAAALGVASQLGDLAESGFKRYVGAKDSGRSIPGHGGLLDRLDGMLAAAFLAGVLALALGRGVALWR
jgi:phosphatidate cytidylyltransferase